MPSPYDVFRDALLRALGDTLGQRGYALQDDAIQIRSGLYRFEKPLDGGARAMIDAQLLFYAGGGPSRFEVKAWRSDRPRDKTKLGMWLREQNIATWADGLGWWEFATAPELEASLQDAARGLETMFGAAGSAAAAHSPGKESR